LPHTTSGLETEWGYSGRMGSDGQALGPELILQAISPQVELILQAISPQVTWVIYLTVGCHYLPSYRVSPPFGWYSFYHPTEGRRL